MVGGRADRRAPATHHYDRGGRGAGVRVNRGQSGVMAQAARTRYGWVLSYRLLTGSALGERKWRRHPSIGVCDTRTALTATRTADPPAGTTSISSTTGRARTRTRRGAGPRGAAGAGGRP